IPNHFMDRFVVDAGKRGLIAKRDDDSQWQGAPVKPFFSQSYAGVVKGKLPFAVQVEPDTTYKLWPRIFRAGDLFSVQNHANKLKELSHKVTKAGGVFFSLRISAYLCVS